MFNLLLSGILEVSLTVVILQCLDRFSLCVLDLFAYVSTVLYYVCMHIVL